jgi:hypothetical protein
MWKSFLFYDFSLDSVKISLILFTEHITATFHKGEWHKICDFKEQRPNWFRSGELRDRSGVPGRTQGIYPRDTALPTPSSHWRVLLFKLYFWDGPVGGNFLLLGS